VDRVVLGIAAFLLVRERERLACPRVVYLDPGSFAAAARGVHQLGSACTRLFRKKSDPEFFAAGREQRVLGVRVLREQAGYRRCRTKRSVWIRATRERIVLASTLGRDPCD